MSNLGVLFSLFSDPYNGYRYFEDLKINFPVKKEIPPVDMVLKLIAEVLTVDGQDEPPPPAGIGLERILRPLRPQCHPLLRRPRRPMLRRRLLPSARPEIWWLPHSGSR